MGGGESSQNHDSIRRIDQRTEHSNVGLTHSLFTLITYTNILTYTRAPFQPHFRRVSHCSHM